MMLEQHPEAENRPKGWKLQETRQRKSKEYDDLNSFRNTTKLELQRLSKRLDEISAKVDNIAQAIDEFQEYSYRYNVKIVGVPEKRTATKETSDETSTLCVALFGAMGVDVSLSDICTAHRVPSRNNPRQEPKPNPIICEFVRRLTREKVMARRSDACKVDPAALGFQDTVSFGRESLRSSDTKLTRNFV